MDNNTSIKGKPKIIVILGPTASGKSDLAVEVALQYNGEIISADSRQVYKGLDIGTGKITRDEMKDVPHHLLDVALPEEDSFTVQRYKKLADKAITEIIGRGRLPIICGGTGFYIQAIVDGLTFPEVPPDRNLRESLAEKSKEELFAELLRLDPARAEVVDQKNPRRLIRAIEIAFHIGKTPRLTSRERYEAFMLGISTDKHLLKEKIKHRLLKRTDAGMIEEARHLHEHGLSFERMEKLGLEYRYLGRYLKGELTREDMIAKLEIEIWNFAKRQMTWFKRDKRIKWFTVEEKSEIFELVKNFLV